nr:hypothetical protein [Fodinicola feengrottensis]
MQQSPYECSRHGKGDVRNYRVRAPGQRHVPQVCVHDPHLTGEPAFQPADEGRISLDRENPRTGTGKRRSERALPRAEFHDQVARRRPG